MGKQLFQLKPGKSGVFHIKSWNDIEKDDDKNFNNVGILLK
jgi:hypothetical protein